MVGEADAAESGVGARAVPGQGAAQAAAAALPGGHGGGRRVDRARVHADGQPGAAVQRVRLAGVGAMADTVGFADAVLLSADARILARVHARDDGGAVAGVVLCVRVE